MADDFAARIDPAILAAALREAEGVEVDPSTQSGAVAAALIVQRVMQDEDALQRLLDVLVRLDETASGESMDYPQEYGPVATSSQVFPDLPMGAPPIGSEEFEQFIDELVRSEQRPSETADWGADSDDPTPSSDGSIK